MKISVIIPAYNAEATIEATINSVLSQTVPPNEILVLDDGSTDNTGVILESYKPYVTVLRQSNQGVAHARNFLCEQARGDIVAFLDADDIWHPCYLEVHERLIEDYPDAIAYFTEHENFYGYGNYQWNTGSLDLKISPELIKPVSFIKRYNKTPMNFQMSGCCIPKKTLAIIGREPFCVSRAEDTYLHHLLPLFGYILYNPVPLYAYRITSSSLSASRLNNELLIIDAFQLLEERYKKFNNSELYSAFKMSFASRRRGCGKLLMGAGRILDARREFRESIKVTSNPVSMAKSLVRLFQSYMPPPLQPKWPSSYRKSRSTNHASVNDEIS